MYTYLYWICIYSLTIHAIGDCYIDSNKKIHEETKRGLCDVCITKFTCCIINNSINEPLPMLLFMQSCQKIPRIPNVFLIMNILCTVHVH